MCSPDQKKRQFDAEVTAVRRLSDEYLRMTIEVPEDVNATPGQFFNLKTGGDPDPTWRRPFSVFNQEGRSAEFYIRVVGRGTRWLADCEPGQVFSVLGALGRGFELPKERTRCLLVAGGVGIAPLHFLYRKLQSDGHDVIVYWGGATAEALEMGNDLPVPVEMATLDGTRGYKGLVTDLVEEYLADHSEPVTIYSCGPEPMLRAMVRICGEAKAPIQVSFESKMACGWGVCLGCPVLLKDGEGGTVYKRVCTEGPVFWGDELAE